MVVDNLPGDIVALLTESFFLSCQICGRADLNSRVLELTTFIPLQDLIVVATIIFLSRYFFDM